MRHNLFWLLLGFILASVAVVGAMNYTPVAMIDPVAGTALTVASGGLPVTLTTLLSGENQSATGANASGVMTVEFAYLNSGSKTADYQVKASAGYVENLVCVGTDGTAVAGSITVADALTETTPIVFTWTVPAANFSDYPRVFPIHTVFATGIYLGFTTTNDVSCNVTYR